jgi:hypothetical protein
MCFQCEIFYIKIPNRETTYEENLMKNSEVIM